MAKHNTNGRARRGRRVDVAVDDYCHTLVFHLLRPRARAWVKAHLKLPPDEVHVTDEEKFTTLGTAVETVIPRMRKAGLVVVGVCECD
jgi:hypothetical protein